MTATKPCGVAVYFYTFMGGGGGDTVNRGVVLGGLFLSYSIVYID